MVVAAEAAVPLTLAFRATAGAGFLFAGVVLIAFTGAIALSLGRGTSVPCPCFGPSGTPLGRRHIARNVALLMAALGGGVGTLSVNADDPRAAGASLSLLLALVGTALLIRLDDLIDILAPAGSLDG